MKTSTLSVLSLGFGVVGMCIGCIVIGIIPSLIGLVLGIIALTDDLAYKWPSILGIICSAIGIMFFGVIMLDYYNSNYDNKIITPKEIFEEAINTNKTDSEPQVDQENSVSLKNDNKDIFYLGEMAELNGVAVTMTNFTENSGSEFNYPAEGNVYILVEFEIVNNSNSDLAISSLLSFTAYCNDYKLDYSLGAIVEKGASNQLDGTIAAGKRMKGVVGWEVPADWENIEIHFIDNMWDNNTFKFMVEK